MVLSNATAGHQLAAELAGEVRRVASEIAHIREELEQASRIQGDKVGSHSGAQAGILALRSSLALRENASALLSEAIMLAELFDKGGPIEELPAEPSFEKAD
eukprot:TRINITY_DN31283_c0_g1_i1.p1 TRINITY_DN31283_c0_g1~~TRINITY_DN31283_c0_g1_i1.p1  ORF type:complete len:102 (-),score=29.30 TRINITY_DN31283_c0_g1_i1:361-666(-)